MTKFTRQLSTAMRLVDKFGVACTWKNFPPEAGSTPEFPSQGDAFDHAVMIAFIPLSRESDFTYRNEYLLGGGVPAQFFGYMGGDYPFTPNNGDQIMRPDGTLMTLVWQNVIQPDLVPLAYELAFT